jgi:hypothetical protein
VIGSGYLGAVLVGSPAGLAALDPSALPGVSMIPVGGLPDDELLAADLTGVLLAKRGDVLISTSVSHDSNFIRNKLLLRAELAFAVLVAVPDAARKISE